MDRTDGRQLMLVHAHPDDESIGTGATMAKYAAQGAGVTLVTCTLGELGEIIPPDLADLAWDKENRLGEHRIGELAAACAALGVTDHRFLGGAGRWHDSGMMGTPSNDWDGAFWRADVDEAAGVLLDLITRVRPQVLVTYDSNGFYGHPDHIQAHLVAWRAFELADGLVRKFYATAVPRSVLAEGIRLMREASPGETGEPSGGPGESGGPGGSGGAGGPGESGGPGAAGFEFQAEGPVDDQARPPPHGKGVHEIVPRADLTAAADERRPQAGRA